MVIFEQLLHRYGSRHWWPGETPFEVCVGAILTQNTSWDNVEKAITNLKAQGALTPDNIAQLSPEELASLIKPAGYFNVKARRLQAFVSFVQTEAGGDLDRLFQGDWRTLRDRLLTVHGIGPETADSILLYAGNKPSFVVDAYTRRIFSRLGLVLQTIGYEELRSFFVSALPTDVALFNEYHALIVEHGKQVCRARPRCAECCLAVLCHYATNAP